MGELERLEMVFKEEELRFRGDSILEELGKLSIGNVTT